MRIGCINIHDSFCVTHVSRHKPHATDFAHKVECQRIHSSRRDSQTLCTKNLIITQGTKDTMAPPVS